jgi:TatD DNase family protein
VIHSRSATAETLAAVAPFAQQGLRGIFHCFSGTAAEAQQVVDLGFLLGIGGVATYKNSGLLANIAHIGLEHLVLETDAPYLAPVPHRGRRNESGYLPIVAAALAQAYGVSVDVVAQKTTENARKLFAY